MPKEFFLYGKKIVINDDHNAFYDFYKLVISESKKAISEFTRSCNAYKSIEKLLKNAKTDGDKILSSLFQSIISSVFTKLQIYDIDVSRFRNEFYRDIWSTVIQDLADRYNNLSNQINAWKEKEREDRAEAIGSAIGDLIIGIPLPGSTGLDAETRANKALDKIKKLENEQKKLYDSRSALTDEFSASINGIWESCCKIINEHGVTNSNPMNIENFAKANATVNNMAHMSRNDVLEFIPQLVLSNPFNPKLYANLLSIFGDPNSELYPIANYFGCSNELYAAQDERLDKLLQKAKPDFYFSIETSAEARKKFIEQSRLYGISHARAKKVLDDCLAQAEREAKRWGWSSKIDEAKRLVENWRHDYDESNFPPQQKESTQQRISEPSQPNQTIANNNAENQVQEQPQPLINTERLTKNYEPVTGLTTDALIKRAFLFLEDSQFNDAGRYLNQALNQDAEDARIHLGQLMLIYEAHNEAELIDKLTTPIEEEKLFQRALRFADDNYRQKLEDLAKASRDKLEQERLAKEAEQERLRLEEERKKAEQEAEQERKRIEKEAEEARKKAEEEARKEKTYQEILSLKEKASTVSELKHILSRADSIRTYKDTEQIYQETKKTLTDETKYQEAIGKKSNAKTSDDWKAVINQLEALNDYKDCEELLNQAQEALSDAEDRERARRKRNIISAVVIAILAASAFGIYSYMEKAKRIAEEKRIEEARIAEQKRLEEARIERENTMKAFFEGNYDHFIEASTSKSLHEKNATIAHMRSIIEYSKPNGDYDKFKKLAENIRKEHPNTTQDNYREATALAEKYDSETPARNFLGDVYLNGWGTDKNTQKALDYFKIPAEQGDTYSQANMALIYEAMKDKANATKWYKKLADSGNIAAQNHLRAMQEEQRAREEAAEKKRAEAMRIYSSAELNEANGNLDIALSQFRFALELGHPEAQNKITALQEKINARNNESDDDAYTRAVQYLDEKNYSQAIDIFRKLANNDYAPAQDKLAWMYQNGWGVEQSYSQAVSWFRKAAEQGNTEAMASMGLMYYRGWGVERDYDTSLEWYGKAARQGSEVAQRRINSIQTIKTNKAKIASLEYNGGFPIPGTITAETLSVRVSPNTNSKRVKTLRTGHPVSVSKATESDNDYWLYVRTASGTEGWVLGGYVKLIDRNLSYEETNNRRRSLPKSGYVVTRNDTLNLRNIPAVKGSQVIEKLDSGTSFTAYEVFAGDTVDWYRIRTNYGDEGWVSGKYIELQY